MTPIKLEYPVRISILYFGGKSKDLEDTLEAVSDMKRALESRGHMVRAVEVSNRNWRKAVFVPGEVFFNLVEDPGYKLYEKVGISIEEMGKAQIGHDMKTFRYSTKKAKIKRRLKKMGLKTPNFRIFTRRYGVTQIRGMEYPLIVKPSGEHASIGITQESVVIDESELRERVKYLFENFPGEVLAEEYIDGREIHVAVIGNGRYLATLPYSEVVFKGEFANNWNVYSYAAKWELESWENRDSKVICPTSVSSILDKRIERQCVKAYRAIGCRDIARFDIMVDDKERPFIIDVNESPGLSMGEQDEVWASARALNWSYEDLLETIVGMAYKRVYGKMPDRIRERRFLLPGKYLRI